MQPLPTALSSALAAEARSLQEAGVQSLATINPFLGTASDGSRQWSCSSQDEQLEQLGLQTLSLLPRISVTGDRDGTTAAEFCLSARLGAGGMGVVYAARQRTLDRDVAIKRPRGSTGADRDVFALLREAVMTGHLEHPNIVPVHALGRDEEDRPLLVMKKVDGVAWRELLHNPHHPAWPKFEGNRLRWQLGVLVQVCNAVHYAHSRGIVHRDIKPMNVMIGAFGEVYLLDWGVGLRLDDLAAQTEKLVGTPAYMAPEMLDSSFGPISPRTDVYLLGATLHEILTGEPRHRSADLFAAMDDALASLPYDYGQDVPGELAAICNRCCHRDPELRYESAQELRLAIQAYLSHRASHDLAAATMNHLGALRQLAAEAIETRDIAGTHLHFNACRFGFDQALASWPDNTAAHAGKQEAIALMVQVEIDCANPSGAEILLAELDHPRPALQEQLAELNRRLAHQRQLAADRDLSVSSLFRLRYVQAITANFFLFLIGGLIHNPGPSPPDPGFLIVPPAVITAILAIAAAIGWRSMVKNAMNRQIAFSALLVSVVMTSNRVAAYVTDIDVGVTQIYDCFLCATMALIGCFVIRPALALAAVAFCVATIVGFAHPPRAMTAFLTAMLISNVWLVLVGIRDTRRLPVR
ncbi:MAG: serine/threonine protein kinase [Candidatus Schekmanbacteria bacterium]|nr:serine/threonine protein kinase [Candidatus Schekmanbacteria bacterium]